MSGHAGFIFAAYGVSALVIALLTGWIVFAQRARKAELSALEQAGIRRRSDPK